MTPTTSAKPQRSEVIKRLYQRNGRWYLDLRKYHAGRIPLAPEGANLATTDYDEALAVASAELARAKHDAVAMRENKVARFMTVREAARGFEEELVTRVERKQLSASTKTRYELALRQLLGTTDEHGDPQRSALNQDMRIDRLTVDDVRGALSVLYARVTRRGARLSPSSINHVLVVLRVVCQSARAARCAPSGFNPVGDLRKSERPVLSDHRVTDFLEVPEVAALLDAIPVSYDGTLPLYEIAATMLYTGGRKNEVLGLEIRDIDLDRNLVHFRENSYRGLKRHQQRVVPLWSELREILVSYLSREGRVAGLVFRPPHDPEAAHLITTDLIGPLQEAHAAAIREVPVKLRASFAAKRVHPHAFRSTYCSARLQTLDNGRPVSLLAVRTELGHKSQRMIEEVYGKLGSFRYRGETVSYRLSGEAEARSA
jgi:integrase